MDPGAEAGASAGPRNPASEHPSERTGTERSAQKGKRKKGVLGASGAVA